MGMIMIRCPKTRRAVSTGIIAEREDFRASPVFFSRVLCPHCRATHEWFAKDAWICDSDSSCDPNIDHCNCEQRAA